MIEKKRKFKFDSYLRKSLEADYNFKQTKLQMKSFFALAALAVVALAAEKIPIDDLSTADIQSSEDSAALAASYELSLQDLFKKAQANDVRKANEAQAAELEKAKKGD